MQIVNSIKAVNCLELQVLVATTNNAERAQKNKAVLTMRVSWSTMEMAKVPEIVVRGLQSHKRTTIARKEEKKMHLHTPKKNGQFPVDQPTFRELPRVRWLHLFT